MEVIGLNSLMSGQAEDFFTLREIVIECEKRETHLWGLLCISVV